MAINGKFRVHIDLKTISEKIAELSNSKSSMTYNRKTNCYYINDVQEETLNQLGFKFLMKDAQEKPIYKFEDIYVTLRTSYANGNIIVYKE